MRILSVLLFGFLICLSAVTAIAMSVQSSAAPEESAIPVDYTCDGKGSSPQISWSDAPSKTRLKDALLTIIDQYDYILVDCPPSLNVLTLNALVAAHSVLIPIQCEYFALEGLTALLNTIEQIQSTLNPQLHIEGLLRTMYDGRNRLALDVSASLLQHFPDRVYRTVIPRNVRLAEAPSHGMPVITYDEKSQGSVAYLTLAGEILRRAEEREKSQPSPVTG